MSFSDWQQEDRRNGHKQTAKEPGLSCEGSQSLRRTTRSQAVCGSLRARTSWCGRHSLYLSCHLQASIFNPIACLLTRHIQSFGAENAPCSAMHCPKHDPKRFKSPEAPQESPILSNTSRHPSGSYSTRFNMSQLHPARRFHDLDELPCCSTAWISRSKLASPLEASRKPFCNPDNRYDIPTVWGSNMNVYQDINIDTIT